MNAPSLKAPVMQKIPTSALPAPVKLQNCDEFFTHQYSSKQQIVACGKDGQ